MEKCSIYIILFLSKLLHGILFYTIFFLETSGIEKRLGNLSQKISSNVHSKMFEQSFNHRSNFVRKIFPITV